MYTCFLCWLFCWFFIFFHKLCSLLVWKRIVHLSIDKCIPVCTYTYVHSFSKMNQCYKSWKFIMVTCDKFSENRAVFGRVKTMYFTPENLSARRLRSNVYYLETPLLSLDTKCDFISCSPTVNLPLALHIYFCFDDHYFQEITQFWFLCKIMLLFNICNLHLFRISIFA